MSIKDIKFYIGTLRKERTKRIIVKHIKYNEVYEFDVFRDQKLDYHSVVEWWNNDKVSKYFPSDIESILYYSTIEELKPE